MKQIKVLISGRVQGVWYRGWTVEKANELGVKGWVRNLSSGQVEAVFLGEDTQVNALLEACWSGPQFADVTAVESFADTSDLQDKTVFIQMR